MNEERIRKNPQRKTVFLDDSEKVSLSGGKHAAQPDKKEEKRVLKEKFPNFFSLTSEERMLFRDTLLAARRNLEKRENIKLGKLGTIHDELLRSYSHSSLRSAKSSVEGGDTRLDQSTTSVRSNESRTIILMLPSTKKRHRPTGHSSPNEAKRRKLVSHEGDDYDEMETRASQPSVDNMFQKEVFSDYLKHDDGNELSRTRKFMSRERKQDETEEDESEEFNGDTPNKSGKFCAPKYSELSPEEKRIFFQTLKTAYASVIEKNPSKKTEIIDYSDLVKMYSFIEGSEYVTVKGRDKEIRMKLGMQLGSVDNERIKKFGSGGPPHASPAEIKREDALEGTHPGIRSPSKREQLRRIRLGEDGEFLTELPKELASEVENLERSGIDSAEYISEKSGSAGMKTSSEETQVSEQQVGAENFSSLSEKEESTRVSDSSTSSSRSEGEYGENGEGKRKKATKSEKTEINPQSAKADDKRSKDVSSKREEKPKKPKETVTTEEEREAFGTEESQYPSGEGENDEVSVKDLTDEYSEESLEELSGSGDSDNSSNTEPETSVAEKKAAEMSKRALRDVFKDSDRSRSRRDAIRNPEMLEFSAIKEKDPLSTSEEDAVLEKKYDKENLFKRPPKSVSNSSLLPIHIHPDSSQQSNEIQTRSDTSELTTSGTEYGPKDEVQNERKHPKGKHKIKLSAPGSESTRATPMQESNVETFESSSSLKELESLKDKLESEEKEKMQRESKKPAVIIEPAEKILVPEAPSKEDGQISRHPATERKKTAEVKEGKDRKHKDTLEGEKTARLVQAPEPPEQTNNREDKWPRPVVVH